jgi:hypothetical protein
VPGLLTRVIAPRERATTWERAGSQLGSFHCIASSILPAVLAVIGPRRIDDLVPLIRYMGLNAARPLAPNDHHFQSPAATNAAQ